MATIRVCDKCDALSTEKDIRGYRWMVLMDKNNYKHGNKLKLDLCSNCAEVIEKHILSFFDTTKKPRLE
jgi:hypothetical protein